MAKSPNKRNHEETKNSSNSSAKSPGSTRPRNRPILKTAAQAVDTTGLLDRYDRNPLLTGQDWPRTVNTVFNAGAVRLQTGETLLLCRVEARNGLSHLTAARSTNGVTHWSIDHEPTFAPDPEHYPEEAWGIEDARIVWVSELQRYAVTYTSYSPGGPGVSLALTEDFVTFERYGVIMPPEDKDASLLPRRIGDYWALIHRPHTSAGDHIWISYSPDLRHWGSHRTMLYARRGPWWDAVRIGMGPPVIETSEGWLMLYHGVRQTAAGALYRVGLALFDLETPEICLLRSEEWIFGPETHYEQVGDVHGVVFPCGYTVEDDGDSLNLYYGAADTSVCLARAKVSQLLAWLKTHGRPGGEIQDKWSNHWD